MKRQIFPYALYSIIAISSYFLASHYVYQWWQNILLAMVIIAVVIGLRVITNHQLDHLRILVFFFLLLTFILVPKLDNQTDEYRYCGYPPYEIQENTAIPMNAIFGPYTINTTDFQGFYTYANTSVSIYNELTQTVQTTTFFYNGLSEIFSVAIFDGYVYVAGEYLENSSGNTIPRYSIVRYELGHTSVEEYLISDYYLQAFNVGEYLLISEYDEDTTNERVYTIYDTSMNIVTSETVGTEYIKSVFEYQEYDVIVSSKSIDLYQDGTYKATLRTVNSTNYKVFVSFNNDKIYLPIAEFTPGNFELFVYDLNGTKIDEVVYPLESSYDQLILTESKTIVNISIDMDDYVVTSSQVYDQEGNEVCYFIGPTDLILFQLNNTMYGSLDNQLYLVEEISYTVWPQYAYPQHGLIFWISAILLSGAVIITKRDTNIQ